MTGPQTGHAYYYVCSAPVAVIRGSLDYAGELGLALRRLQVLVEHHGDGPQQQPPFRRGVETVVGHDDQAVRCELLQPVQLEGEVIEEVDREIGLDALEPLPHRGT
jgi:hypothetical protein